jgi:hypothetical protein
MGEFPGPLREDRETEGMDWFCVLSASLTQLATEIPAIPSGVHHPKTEHYLGQSISPC